MFALPSESTPDGYIVLVSQELHPNDVAGRSLVTGRTIVALLESLLARQAVVPLADVLKWNVTLLFSTLFVGIPLSVGMASAVLTVGDTPDAVIPVGRPGTVHTPGSDPQFVETWDVSEPEE